MSMFDQAFSRTAGASLVHGNAVRLLRDARENYPAWTSAMEQAKETIHFECYIIHDDAVGRRFSDLLLKKAGEGVRVRIVYDWLGGWQTRGRFWRRLREGGVDVRCFNRPRLDDPLGALVRDHRKCVVVDGGVAFVFGLCVGQAWEGYPEKQLAGWRDTGVEIRGPAVADVARAFAETWAACGEALPAGEMPAPAALAAQGDVSLRVVASTSGTSELFRLDSLVAALARGTLWRTDAYDAGTPSYVQALRAAAGDGVAVRLLVPGRGSDIAVVQAISRAGYRPLLDGGVRVFEWNGPMVHAKTAVADARWARVGSTNLNPASWLGNWELDVVVEDQEFGRAMEAMYLEDLARSTEIVLEQRRRVRPATMVNNRRKRGAGGSTGRAAAGAFRAASAIGAALASRRVHGAAERRVMVSGAIVLAVFAAAFFLWPKALAWPLGLLCAWMAVTLVIRAARVKPGRAAEAPATTARKA